PVQLRMSKVVNSADAGGLRDLKEGGFGSHQKPAPSVRIIVSDVGGNLDNIQLSPTSAGDLLRAHARLDWMRRSSVFRSRCQSFLVIGPVEPLRTPSRSFASSSSVEETRKP